MPDDPNRQRATLGRSPKEAADALMAQERRILQPWNYIDRQAYEKGAEFWNDMSAWPVVANRRRKRHEHHVDNQGLCHRCGKLMDRDWWELYAGKGAPVPRRKRKTSRGLRANTVPPPPTGRHDLRDWISRTFAPGTAVRLKKTAWATVHGADDDSAKLPTGTVGTVSHVKYGGTTVVVEGNLSVPMFASSSVYRFETDFGADEVDEYLEPLDDNWGPLVIPSKRSYGAGWTPKPPRYKGTRPNGRRTSRMARNVATSVPMPSDSQPLSAWNQWIETTFRAGTPAMVKGVLFYFDSATQRTREVPKGARVATTGRYKWDGGKYMVEVRVLDARDEAGYQVEAVGQITELPLRLLEPLVDNWASQRPLKRYQLPTSQRRTSYKLRANMIPPPPRDPTKRMLLAWAQRTYAPGTPVALEEQEWYVGRPYPKTVERFYVPDGTRGVVESVSMYQEPYGGTDEVWVSVRLHDARAYARGNMDVIDLELLEELWRELDQKGTDIISKPLYPRDYLGKVRPLADNWPETKPMKRLALPASQRRTSYKMR